MSRIKHNADAANMGSKNDEQGCGSPPSGLGDSIAIRTGNSVGGISF
jgi:hypothetical protein